LAEREREIASFLISLLRLREREGEAERGEWNMTTEVEALSYL
jgi:hypothetical protein